MTDIDDRAERFIAAATRHAEDSGEPEHEVGDLQDLFRTAYKMLSPEQRTAFETEDLVVDVLVAGGDEEEPAPRF